MIYNKYEPGDYSTSSWSGGTTTEITIYPKSAVYAQRDFIYRVSSALVELEESDFTSLPDYDRTLIVLEGETTLAHEKLRSCRLGKYEKDCFSGSWNTKSYGKIRDFNLMVRKGALGSAEVLELDGNYRKLEKTLGSEKYPLLNWIFYCHEGYAIVSAGNQQFKLEAGEALEIIQENLQLEGASECQQPEELEIGIMGQGHTIVCQVAYHEDQVERPEDPKLADVYGPSVLARDSAKANIETGSLQKEKQPAPTLEDLKLSALLSYSSFRGGKRLFRTLRDTWYDRALQRKLDIIENLFISFFLCIIGAFLVFANLFGKVSDGVALAFTGLWVAVFLVLLNPLIYLMFLPRPVRSHIIPLSELTEEERRALEEDARRNKRAERILKKYRITGRNKYIDQ